MTNTRWQFWLRTSSSNADTPPDANSATSQISPPTTSTARASVQTEPEVTPRQPHPSRSWWRFARQSRQPSRRQPSSRQPVDAGAVDNAGDDAVINTETIRKRRWWQRSPLSDANTAPVFEQTEFEQTDPRPLNPDGTLPPDLLEQLNAPQTTGMNRAMKAYLRRFAAQVAQADAQGNTAAVVSDVDDKLEHMNRGKLTAVWQKVQLLGKLMRDPAAHWQSKVVALASLIYVVSPLDAIPDVIPGLGLADDVAVVVTVVSYLGSALNRYAQTELKQQLEDHSDREIKKHLRKNRISLLYAAAAAALVLVVALLIQNLG